MKRQIEVKKKISLKLLWSISLPLGEILTTIRTSINLFARSISIYNVFVYVLCLMIVKIYFHWHIYKIVFKSTSNEEMYLAQEKILLKVGAGKGGELDRLLITQTIKVTACWQSFKLILILIGQLRPLIRTSKLGWISFLSYWKLKD